MPLSAINRQEEAHAALAKPIAATPPPANVSVHSPILDVSVEEDEEDDALCHQPDLELSTSPDLSVDLTSPPADDAAKPARLTFELRNRPLAQLPETYDAACAQHAAAHGGSFPDGLGPSAACTQV